MGIRCIFSLRFAHTVGYLKLKSGEEIQKLAMRTHREVQQREDIRRDLAERKNLFLLTFVQENMCFIDQKIRVRSSKKGSLEDG